MDDDTLYDIRAVTGLSVEEAHRRFIEEGPNELPSAKPRTVWQIAASVLREPMLLLLLAGGVLYQLLGDLQESLILLSFVFVVMGITFWQERKTENALGALRDLSSPRALVIRDGAQTRIPGREVVRGDLLLLAEGDRVPADALVTDCLTLSIDEALLTGESVPVNKIAAKRLPSDGETPRPGGDGTPYVFSGTLVVKGQGTAVVRRTGTDTEIGKIGTALKRLEPERTKLQREIDRLVRNLAVTGLSLCALVIVVYGLTRHDWLHGTLAGITLAMAMLPEEFPVVLTVFLALGAWRISKAGVLTRRMPAVETLGSTTVLAVDKTGTLTQNHMTIRAIETDGHEFHVDDQEVLPEEFHDIVEYGILASPIDPFDPMDVAFKDLGDRFLAQTEHLHAAWTLVREYPLSEDLLAISHVWTSVDGADYVIASKGAPEAVADLCHLSAEQEAGLGRRVSALADQGLRVLGVAQASFKASDSLPTEQHEFDFEFLGLIGLEDPIRPMVPKAVEECYAAGIRVVMITGDYPGTASAIAERIGLSPRDMVVTGPQIEQLTDEELAERCGKANVFARVVPEQKLRIVRALQANGEIVAMTGDGVNDAPAVKAADIGIAMGLRGTDVAREAADLVLTDDDFSSIVGAARAGRRIYDNLRKAMGYIFAVHVPIAGMSILPVLLPRLLGAKTPLLLMPVHIAFLELIIDPACSIVYETEKEEPDIMRRPPRPIDAPVFGRRLIGLSVMQGVVVLMVTAAVFVIALAIPHELVAHEQYVRTLTFTTLVLSNIGLILANLSWSSSIVDVFRSGNRALWWVMGLALAFLAIAIYVPPVRALFLFAPLDLVDIAVALGATALGIAWFEGWKRFRCKNGRSVA